MGNDDGSSQVVRLKEWDMQSLEGLGYSIKEFGSQRTHLWNGNNSSTSFAFYIIIISISSARGEND
jgi:hypothetical protein